MKKLVYSMMSLLLMACSASLPAPAGKKDVLQTGRFQEIEIAPLENDLLPNGTQNYRLEVEGQAYTDRPVTFGKNGNRILMLANNKIKVWPKPDFVGQWTLSYKVYPENGPTLLYSSSIQMTVKDRGEVLQNRPAGPLTLKDRVVFVDQMLLEKGVDAQPTLIITNSEVIGLRGSFLENGAFQSQAEIVAAGGVIIDHSRIYGLTLSLPADARPWVSKINNTSGQFVTLKTTDVGQSRFEDSKLALLTTRLSTFERSDLTLGGRLEFYNNTVRQSSMFLNFNFLCAGAAKNNNFFGVTLQARATFSDPDAKCFADLTENHWGTRDLSQINQMIDDAQDFVDARAVVRYQPILSEPVK